MSFLDDVPALQTPLPKPKGGGMFGGGGKFGLKEALAYGLAGFVSRRNPAILQGLLGMQLHKQKDEREEEQYQRHRQDTFSDWQRQQQYKVGHPEMQPPHYFEDNSGNQMLIGPDGKPQMVYQDPNPFKLVPNGMGGVIPVNMQALMQGGQPEIISQLPPGAKPIGGAGPSQAPQTFPFRY